MLCIWDLDAATVYVVFRCYLCYYVFKFIFHVVVYEFGFLINNFDLLYWLLVSSVAFLIIVKRLLFKLVAEIELEEVQDKLIM